MLIAPVSHHRMVYARRQRDLVRTTDRFVRTGLVLLLIAMVGAVHLARPRSVGVSRDCAAGLQSGTPEGRTLRRLAAAAALLPRRCGPRSGHRVSKRRPS
ncbi:MAG: DUF6328 family protein [Mycobacteriales bacterium]